MDLGFERVRIPVRVTYEFEVREGKLVPDTLSWRMLYNRKILQARYPGLNMESLDNSVDRTVSEELHHYLRQIGYESRSG